MIESIPFELLNLGVSTAFGAFIKYKANEQANQRELFSQAIKSHGASERSMERAAKIPAAGPWVRRFIAVVCICYLFLAPVIIALLGLDVPIYYAYLQEIGGLKLFGGDRDVLKLTEMSGLVFTPTHNNVVISIAGFYFGTGVMKR